MVFSVGKVGGTLEVIGQEGSSQCTEVCLLRAKLGVRWGISDGKDQVCVLRFECNDVYGGQSWGYVGGYWTVKVRSVC